MILSGSPSFFVSKSDGGVRERQGKEDAAVVFGLETLEDFHLLEAGGGERRESGEFPEESAGNIYTVRTGNIGLGTEVSEGEPLNQGGVRKVMGISGKNTVNVRGKGNALGRKMLGEKGRNGIA